MVLALVVGRGVTAVAASSDWVCPSPGLQLRQAYEVGLFAQSLLPNLLPDFDKSLLVYGPSVGIPVGEHTIHLAGYYGASEGVSSYGGEAAYRFNITTPFFYGHLLAGANYLHYAYNSMDHNQLGGLIGLGLSVPVGKDFKGGLMMKIYLHHRTIVSFGGGFAFTI